MSQNHGDTQVIVSRGDILLLCLHNPSYEVDRMIRRLAFNYILTDGDLYTVETLKMILFRSVWIQIKPMFPWKRFKKEFVVHINRLLRWSGPWDCLRNLCSMSYSIIVFADCNDNLINRTNIYTKMCKTCLERYYEKRTNKIRGETESKQ